MAVSGATGHARAEGSGAARAVLREVRGGTRSVAASMGADAVVRARDGEGASARRATGLERARTGGRLRKVLHDVWELDRGDHEPLAGARDERVRRGSEQR